MQSQQTSVESLFPGITAARLMDAWTRAEEERIERMQKPDDALFTAALAAQDALDAVPYSSPDKSRLDEAHKQASLAWLRERKGAGIGDCVCAFGWAKPRDILVEDFRIERSRSDKNDVYYCFYGPGTTAKGVRRQIHLTPADEALLAIPACDISRSLRRFMAEEASAALAK